MGKVLKVFTPLLAIKGFGTSDTVFKPKRQGFPEGVTSWRDSFSYRGICVSKKDEDSLLDMDFYDRFLKPLTNKPRRIR